MRSTPSRWSRCRNGLGRLPCGGSASSIEAQRAFPIPPHVHPYQRPRFERHLAPGRVLDDHLAVLCKQWGHAGEQLFIGFERVGRIGKNKVEGPRQACKPGWEGEAADLDPVVFEQSGVGFQDLDRRQVVVHRQGRNCASAQGLQRHHSAPGEEIEDAGVFYAVAPDREEGLADPALGGTRSGWYCKAAPAKGAACDPHPRLHFSLDRRATNSFRISSRRTMRKIGWSIPCSSTPLLSAVK